MKREGDFVLKRRPVTNSLVLGASGLGFDLDEYLYLCPDKGLPFNHLTVVHLLYLL